MDNNKKKYGTFLSLVIAIIVALFGYSEVNNSSDVNVDTSKNYVEESYEEEFLFRNKELLNEHYEKHGVEMGFDTPEEYEKAASRVVSNPSALHKTEAEDGDYVYYLESTNEFVIVSVDGYIRTYFKPDRGIDYYNGK